MQSSAKNHQFARQPRQTQQQPQDLQICPTESRQTTRTTTTDKTEQFLDEPSDPIKKTQISKSTAFEESIDQIYKYSKSVLQSGLSFGLFLSFVAFFGHSIYLGYFDGCPYFKIFIGVALFYLLAFIGLIIFNYFYLDLSPIGIIQSHRGFDHGSIISAKEKDNQPVQMPIEVPFVRTRCWCPNEERGEVGPHLINIQHNTALCHVDMTDPVLTMSQQLDEQHLATTKIPIPVDEFVRMRKQALDLAPSSHPVKAKKPKTCPCPCRRLDHCIPKFVPFMQRDPVLQYFRIGDDCA